MATSGAPRLSLPLLLPVTALLLSLLLTGSHALCKYQDTDESCQYWSQLFYAAPLWDSPFISDTQWWYDLRLFLSWKRLMSSQKGLLFIDFLCFCLSQKKLGIPLKCQEHGLTCRSKCLSYICIRLCTVLTMSEHVGRLWFCSETWRWKDWTCDFSDIRFLHDTDQKPRQC